MHPDADTEMLEKFFRFAHLPPKLQEVSKPFCLLAEDLVGRLPPSRERTKALDRLLEAKDAAVRAAL
jgi:hypothetical protein